ncbi:MAG TPA: copper-binding protein [Steroidobacteraceae bacterium]|nr:copper-binding protein [Steroidobacteraceae bacterium]
MNRSYPGTLVAVGLATCCALWPQPGFPHAQITTTVQFDREIVRVLDDHCVMCHVEHGPAFPLVTYEQTYAARWQIRMDALDRHMAPWAAVPGFGDFANDNGLTQPEADFLVSWAESFGPRNNGAAYSGVAADQRASKPVQAHVDLDHWVLGQPDLALTLPANAVAPLEAEVVKRTVIESRLKSPRWLRGLEYKPGDRRVVHAARFTVQETGQWLGTWTPWRGFSSLPPGLAYRLPAGCHIVAELHYFGVKEPAADQGSLGLFFTDQPSQRVVSDIAVAAQALKLNEDLNILALEPSLRRGLRSVEVKARLPDGATRILLFADDIPLAWPTPYVFTSPVLLPKGTELSVIQHFADHTDVTAGTSMTVSAYAGAVLAEHRFKLVGTVKSVDAANGRLVIEHGDIPGFMGAMTMSYSVGTHEDLRKIAAGDQIESDVVSSDTGTYLENIVARRAR